MLTRVDVQGNRFLGQVSYPDFMRPVAASCAPSLSTSEAEPFDPTPPLRGWGMLPIMKNETSSVGFRLRSMAGHLDGVIRMVDEQRDCVEVLYQLSAIQGAVDMVRHQILEAHLRRCVPESLSRAGVGDIVDDLMSATFGSAPPTVRQFRRCHLDAGAGTGSRT